MPTTSWATSVATKPVSMTKTPGSQPVTAVSAPMTRSTLASVRAASATRIAGVEYSSARVAIPKVNTIARSRAELARTARKRW